MGSWIPSWMASLWSGSPAEDACVNSSNSSGPESITKVLSVLVVHLERVFDFSSFDDFKKGAQGKGYINYPYDCLKPQVFVEEPYES